MSFEKRRISISCLPKAGEENPYQVLMMKGLAANPNFTVKYGVDSKLFGFLATCFLQRPHYMHLDWETKYYYRKHLFLTILTLPIFILQLALIKCFTRTRIVWTAHNLTPHDAKHLFIHKICRRYLAYCASWVRVFSEASRPRFACALKISEDKIKVVPEGDYTSYYPNELGTTQARAQLNIPVEKRVLLYFGMIRPYKGLLELIMVFNEMDLENTSLLIAGYPRDQHYFQMVQQEAAQNSNIYVHGRYIEPIDVQVYFNAADVVVLPFKKIENSGSVILAMGFKKPIVAPSGGSLNERLHNQRNLLFSEHPAEVLKSLSQLRSEQLKTIGQANFLTLKGSLWSDFQKCFL